MNRMGEALLTQVGDDSLVDRTLTSGDWLWAATIVVGGTVLAVVVSQVLRRVIARGTGSRFAAIIVSRLVAYVVFLLGVFYALTGLGVRLGPLLGAVGLGGLVLALALQKLVENFVGSLIIQARRPFTVGDTVALSAS